MAENNEGNPTPTPAAEEQDQLKQIKSEFSRKHKEQSELLNQLLSTQAQLQEALQKIANPQSSRSSKNDDSKLEDIMYSDPKRYTEIVKEQAKQEALAAMRSESSSKSEVDNVIARLVNEYPELADAEHELTKESAAYLKTVSDSEKTNPRTYEYAVMKAANALDVKPKSKRPAVEEEFVAPSYSSPQSRRNKRSSEQAINQNKGIAKEFGLNLDDPKMKEKYLNLLKSKGSI